MSSSQTPRGVRRKLLERADVKPNETDTKDGRVLLYWDAENGCEGVGKNLWGRVDVNPDRADTE